MKMKVVAGFAFLVNTVLFATYYAVAKEALGRIDPILFTFFEMILLAPVALAILAFTCQHLTWVLVKRGMLLGSCLCLALFTIAIALKYSTATGTAFFPALNGFLAAFIAWLVLRQPINKATWFAGILSIVGAVLLIANSEMGGIRGAVIAFLGGLFFTLYVFLSDYGSKEWEKQKSLAHWPLLGIELLTMALWASLVALLFGNWQAFHPSFPKDGLIILYVAFACTFLPTLIAVYMQKYISAVTISFIYILEPVLGVVVAYFYLHEVLPLAGYLGGGLVVVGAFVHTCGSVERPVKKAVQKQQVQTTQPFMATLFGLYLSPLLYCCSGVLILYGLGGFPPLAWRELASLAPVVYNWLHPEHRAVASAVLNALLQGPHRQSFLLLLVQALGWFAGWCTLAVNVCRVFFCILTPHKAVRREKANSYTGSGIYSRGESMTGASPVTTIDDFCLALPRDVGSIVVTGLVPVMPPIEPLHEFVEPNELAPVMLPTEPSHEFFEVYPIDTTSISTEKFVYSNAVWDSPLNYSTVEQTNGWNQDTPEGTPRFHFTTEDIVFDTQYDSEGVTTDASSPIIPILSMPTKQRSGEHRQLATRVKLVEYAE